MFLPILGHLLIVSYGLKSEVSERQIYHIDDEISFIFTLLIAAGVLGNFIE